jgi:hypothetical protein
MRAHSTGPKPGHIGVARAVETVPVAGGGSDAPSDNPATLHSVYQPAGMLQGKSQPAGTQGDAEIKGIPGIPRDWGGDLSRPAAKPSRRFFLSAESAHVRAR